MIIKYSSVFFEEMYTYLGGPLISGHSVVHNTIAQRQFY